MSCSSRGAAAKLTRKPLVLAIVGVISGHAIGASNSFTDLGIISPGVNSYAYGNLDGTIVVGQVHVPISGNFSFLWTPTGGMQGIQMPASPPLLGGSPATDLNLNGISANGKVAFGDVYDANISLLSQAISWTQNGGVNYLGYLPGGSDSSARAASADGSVIVGYSSGAQGYRAFRWTSSGGMQSLGTMAGYATSGATGVNRDGSVIVGDVNNVTNDFQAFRWTSAGGMQSLGLPGGWAQSRAAGVSSDGDVVVGLVDNSSGNGSRAFRWTTRSGYQVLGTLNGGTSSYAVAVSGNGAVVVGGSRDGSVTPVFNVDDGNRAFRWSQATGMQKVETWAGVSSLPSPTVYAYGTNYDGSVVVGTLQNGQAFIATGAGVVAMDSVETDSLTGTSQSHMASMNLSGLVFSGAHGNPLMNRPSPGKQSCFWTLGDLGENTANASSSKADLAEIGGCHTLFGETQINLALGHAWSKQQSDSSSSSELRSTYGTVGLLSHFSGAFWGVAEILYQSGPADIRRGYLNAGFPAVAIGRTTVKTNGFRLRAIGEDLIKLSELAVSPYAEISKLRTTTEGYTETAPGFPATFDTRSENSTVARIGAHGILPLSTSTRLLGQVEAAHRLETTGASISGNLSGVLSFSFDGAPVERNWQRFGIGIEQKLGEGIVGLVANRTTQDTGANTWVTVSYRTSF
jgi:probable HAF family extracellular repeat protein